MFINTKNGPIYYEAHGPQDRPAIILTHGATLNCRMFDAQLDGLKDQYRIVVWNMPGHGQSYQLSGPLKISEQSDNVIAIMDELGIEKAVIGGQSLGSWVAQYAAHTYPHRVLGIVSIAGVPMHIPYSKWELVMYRVMNELFRLFPKKALYRWVAKEKAVTPEAREFAEQSMNGLGPKQFYYTGAGMMEAGNIRITAPQHPLLLVHGEHEMPKTVAKVNKEWHANTPDSKYAEIPGAGHNCNQDNPQAFNQALLSFLEGLDLVCHKKNA